MKRKTRNANYELLRIIAMVMVVILHYLNKGGFLGGQTYVPWILEGFCIVSVNVYVLISGYFMTDTKFRPEKLGSFWLQVFFYSAGVPAVLFLAGFGFGGQINAERVLTWIFPILREHYWFATTYFLLYLIAPFLAAGAKRLEKKTFQRILLFLILFNSGAKSVLPFDLALDTGGYDILWFITLFLAAVYIRLYGIECLQKGKRGLWLYLGGVTGICLLSLCYSLIYTKTRKLAGFYGSAYHYNHILCFAASIGLFLFFGGITVRNKTAEKWIIRVASCTFGIYLLHENEAIRFLWPMPFAVLGFLPGLIASVAVVYSAGIVIELIRQKLFSLIKRKRTGQKE